MTKRVDLNTEQEVIRLYTTRTENGWVGSYEIAKRLGISHGTVQNILIRNNVGTRDSKQAYEFGKRTKPIKNVPVGQKPLCKCGCGKFVEWNQRKNGWNIFREGHYRKDLPYKNADWLRGQYDSGRTLREIGKQFGVVGSVIKKFAKKFSLTIRSHSETLKMRGSTKGSKNPAWKGGTTPERQSIQKTDEWKTVVQLIYKRDGYKCKRCGHGHNAGRKFHAHHIKSFSKYPDLRLSASNLVTLCNVCHLWVHSKENVNQDFISL